MLTLLLTGLVLRGPSPGVELTWEAPPGCPELDEIRRRLAEYLGEQTPAEVGAGVQAVARVDEGGETRLLLEQQPRGVGVEQHDVAVNSSVTGLADVGLVQRRRVVDRAVGGVGHRHHHVDVLRHLLPVLAELRGQ